MRTSQKHILAANFEDVLVQLVALDVSFTEFVVGAVLFCDRRSKTGGSGRQDGPRPRKRCHTPDLARGRCLKGIQNPCLCLFTYIYK